MAMPHSWIGCKRARKSGLVISLLTLTATLAAAQDLMTASGPGGAVRLFTSDAAILEARDTRKDLPCNVTPVKLA